MNKTEALTALKNNGYKVHDTDGILYIDMVSYTATDIKEIRKTMDKLGYHNSWGIRKVAAGVSSIDNTDTVDDLELAVSEETVVAAADTAPEEVAAALDDNISPAATAAKNLDDDMDTDALFDIETAKDYEQYSLFDMVAG
ncbi:hypothetical protein [Butyrivibrio sp. MC2013]|uniref:hypothetical protein n=1 Tax=Butyrivibrio sp. MC2013 TaxID=1280686 RepID=UPI00041521D6|nr:hypothetical protein [Butyrivibrio sp. MC2013]